MTTPRLLRPNLLFSRPLPPSSHPSPIPQSCHRKTTKMIRTRLNPPPLAPRVHPLPPVPLPSHPFLFLGHRFLHQLLCLHNPTLSNWLFGWSICGRLMKSMPLLSREKTFVSGGKMNPCSQRGPHCVFNMKMMCGKSAASDYFTLLPCHNNNNHPQPPTNICLS